MLTLYYILLKTNKNTALFLQHFNSLYMETKAGLVILDAVQMEPGAHGKLLVKSICDIIHP